MLSYKPNILIVGPYTRYDYLEQFNASKHDFNFFFLEFVSPREESNKQYLNYGKAVYWSDFRNAFELLEYVKPLKVLFIFIESYNHVALNAACQVRGVHTFIIDHGILDVNINFRLNAHFSKQVTYKSLRKRIIFFSLLKERLMSRLFLRNTLKLLPPSFQKDLRQFIQIRSKNRFEEAIKTGHFNSRLPNTYITFSKKNFSFYLLQDKYISESAVRYIGIPLFDELANIKPSTSYSRTILFIDQPLATKKLLGWDVKYHSEFVSNLKYICQKLQYRLYIKLHPLQSIQEKKNWSEDHSNVILPDISSLKNILTETHVVLGFFSTLLLPLACLEHTTLITLENHPVGKLDVSKSFIDAGVAHPIYSLDELPWALENIEELHQRQLPNKKKFEEDWLYKFDGKAGERLRNILLSEEL